MRATLLTDFWSSDWEPTPRKLLPFLIRKLIKDDNENLDIKITIIHNYRAV